MAVLQNIGKVMSAEGFLLFRDYAVNDHAMIRFKPGSKVKVNKIYVYLRIFKIADQLYVRHDGTRSYFFEKEAFQITAESAGFEVVEIEYCLRQTTNVKEKLNAERIFLQAVLRKKP